MEKTRREEIIEMLKENSWTLDSLSKFFDVSYKIIEDDLLHIEKSLKKTYSLKQIPPCCENCGFIFSKRNKMQKPSRCPECKKERITEGTISLVSKKA